MNLRQIIAGGTAHLRAAQRKDGGFDTHTSRRQHPFKTAGSINTPFTTALMLRALHTVIGTDDIQADAAKFLLQQKTPQWSWNYWATDAAERNVLPYPDDLDDTACALAALQLHDASSIDGHVAARIAQLLIACETAPGGPYRTWLVGTHLHSTWGDIDIAVNANIGHLLALQDVSLPGLLAFIDKKIQKRELTSPYYVGQIPTLYFLALWYKGNELPTLQAAIQDELRTKQLNALELSLLITSGCNLGLSYETLHDAVQNLIKLRRTDHWPAESFFKHTAQKNQLPFAGSAALTTAHALQALSSYHQHTAQTSQARPVLKQRPAILTPALALGAQLPDPSLKRRYLAAVRHTIAHDTHGQITAIATHTATAYGYSLDSTTEKHLNLASLHGWIAYTIFDDFLDNEGTPHDIGVATFALRQTVDHFQAALPDNPTFQSLVRGALNTVDAANHWEISHTRARTSKVSITLSHIPDYADLSQLAHRSWGHTLAACGVVMARASANAEQEVMHLQTFFRHFLIARQLNDDAHDWEEDLLQGRISSCVAQLLRDAGHKRVHQRANLPSLRTLFWEHTITSITDQILHHSAAARTALGSTQMKDPSQFLTWLEPLEQSARDAQSARANTLKFITTYTGTAQKLKQITRKPPTISC